MQRHPPKARSESLLGDLEITLVLAEFAEITPGRSAELNRIIVGNTHTHTHPFP